MVFITFLFITLVIAYFLQIISKFFTDIELKIILANYKNLLTF